VLSRIAFAVCTALLPDAVGQATADVPTGRPVAVPVLWQIGQSNANGSISGYWLSNPASPGNRWPHLAWQPEVRIWWPGASTRRPTSLPAWESYRTGWLPSTNNATYYINEGNFGVECSMTHAAAQALGGQVFLFKFAAVAALNPRARPTFAKSAGPGEVYDRMLREWAAATRWLAARGLVPDVQGVFWVHGEQDAFAPPPDTMLWAREYEAHVRQLIRDLREDLAPSGDQERRPIPFVIVQLHDRHEPRATWQAREDVLRGAQARIADDDPMTGLCSVERIEVDPATPSAIHYTPAGTIELGFEMFRTWRFDLAVRAQDR
jgi:hypothetical protein